MREFIGLRVDVVVAGGKTLRGVVRGVRPADGVVLLQRDDWREVEIPGDTVEEITEIQETCSRCGGRVPRLSSDGERCVDCVRTLAATARAVGGTDRGLCEECGASPAFRNPSLEDIYRCADCHRKAGTLPRPRTVEEISCMGQPASDPRHAWTQIRDSRYVCSNCRMNVYETKPPSDDIREGRRSIIQG